MKARFLLVLLLTSAFSCPAVAEPQYASDETKRVIEAMVDAHGGIEIWRAAPSIRFDDIMHNPFHQKNEFAWWAAHEVIDQKTRQVWQDWPMDDAQIRAALDLSGRPYLVWTLDMPTAKIGSFDT